MLKVGGILLVRNADRMMMAASLLDDGIQLSFADGCKGLVPFAEIPEVRDRVNLSVIELPNPYEIILETVSGERIEIPWDFARHYCNESYRTTIEALAIQGRQTLGERIRSLRESAGFTQEALARAAGIGRVTLVRLENGEQSPRHKTLSAVAHALSASVHELLVAPDVLPAPSP